ncbi:alpha/beta fold hydrolase [bacterium]|nr:alpha/beta fold hydrolase [bacterium]
MSGASDLKNAGGREIGPIRMGSGDIGALLIHGYLATPEEMRGLAEHLAENGLRVFAPLVAGHGTTLRELAKTSWRDWHASVESALTELQGECAQVFAVGISLGGLQALHLAAHHQELAGVVALAPPAVLFFDERRFWRRSSDLKLWALSRMPYLAKLYRGEPSDAVPKFLHADIRDEDARKKHIYYYFNPASGVLELLKYVAHVRAELSQVTQPLLLLHSPLDHTVPPKSPELVLARVGSADKTLDLETAASSWHVLTEDVDAAKVYSAVCEFIISHAGGE